MLQDTPLQHFHNSLSMAGTQLLGIYQSSTTTHTFSSELPPLPQGGGSVEEKTSYLSALRANVSKLQGDVNAFLTQKMEEDKSNERSSKKRDEEKEEEMYGEEDPEKEG
ncbi:Hypothetical predicted protein [Lecanosticta acicola]|uniref:EKC/KEOPS complex subunit GON7 n=1 Tax=Lecanosticta acicola TaxID=111012 RepID=A0AAI8YWS8_9PEZI|nr:Hypothetical predicted protein [Lecanosticta acicola]